MQGKISIQRILKSFGKVMAWMLLLLGTLVLLVHIPFVQEKIGNQLARALSRKLQGTVQIEDLRFSLSGHVRTGHIKLSGPDKEEVIAIGNLEIRADVLDILSGDYQVHEVKLNHVSGRYIEDENGSNLQFLFDAFPADTSKKDTSASLSFLIHNIIIGDLTFVYASIPDSTKADIHWHDLRVDSFAYHSSPDQLKAARLFLDQPDFRLLTKTASVAVEDDTPAAALPLFAPDFNIGIGIDIRNIVMADGHFSLHQDSIVVPEAFDPNHIDLSRIQMQLTDAMTNEDTAGIDIVKLSAYLAGLDTVHVQAIAGMNTHTLEINDFMLAAAGNEVNAHLSARPEKDTPYMFQADLDLEARLTSALLDYLTHDTYKTYTDNLHDISVSLTGKYIHGKGQLSSLALTTKESQVNMNGTITGLENQSSLGWEKLNLRANIGNDLKRLITSVAGSTPLPPSIQLTAITTGYLEKFNLNGRLLTTWGNLQANGLAMPKGNGLNLDMQLTSEHIQAGKWIDLPWLGIVDASVHAAGFAGKNMNLTFDGNISSLSLMDSEVTDIDIEGGIRPDSINVSAEIHDVAYTSRIVSSIYPADLMRITAHVETDSFHLGHLLHLDSSLLLTGKWNINIETGDTVLVTDAKGQHVEVNNNGSTYSIDSMSWLATFSPSLSEVLYESPDAHVSVTTNFDLLDWPEQWATWNDRLLFEPASLFQPGGTKKLHADISLSDQGLLSFAGISVDSFDGLDLTGDLDEADEVFHISGQSGPMGISGISADSMQADVSIHGDSLTAAIAMEGLGYKTTALGDFLWTAYTDQDTVNTHLSLLRDTTTIVEWESRILANADQILVYTDALKVMDTSYVRTNQAPVIHENGNYIFDDFQLSHGDMSINIDGDTSAIHAELQNLDLTRLNSMLFNDTVIIGQGLLGVNLSYTRNSKFELTAGVDSLRIYGSAPLQLHVKATTEDEEVPFSISALQPGNTINLEGRYSFNTEEVKAKANLDITDPDILLFLLDDYLSDLNGHISGEADIRGPLLEPRWNGRIRFDRAAFETIRPRMQLQVPDEEVVFTDTSIVLTDFKVLDPQARPLTIEGNLQLKPMGAYTYDLRFKGDRFTLMQPDPTHQDDLEGLLILGTDTRLHGNEKDTYIQSATTIDDSTSLVYHYGSEENELINTEGIVEFVDPTQLNDTTLIDIRMSTYDSLVATLPDFNLNADITVKDKATLKIILDQVSGDYIEASGGGKLELGYDRTGNLHLAGNYILTNGIYSLSFYNLVKKNFTLVPGSSIRWSGNPRTGDLDIQAAYTVQSNSIGLIGNEVSENEKSVYKRSLAYIIGINIEGTLEKPNVYFTLDLPETERASYPVLASKLDRLSQPEFQSELNKQVFGLLALGGFLPESSGADVNSNQIATTALYNSVNAVLAAQVNRFASQYLKGVNIDVGIQSYSDYSTSGSGTKTAMDFRVSKSILDDRLSFEVGGDFDINTDQSGANTGDNYRGDVAIIYDLTGNNDKQLKLFNNESYDIVYQEIRNTGISLIFIREFNKGERVKKKKK